MKKQILILLLLAGLNAYTQDSKFIDFKSKINQYDLSCLFIPKSIPESYEDYTIAPGDPIGFFGENFQRIHIKFLTVIHQDKDSETYLITGKTMLKDNICPFSGKMRIIESKIFRQSDIPEFKQGYVVFEYEFSEDILQGGIGVFKGKAKSNFFIDEKNDIYYDAIHLAADGYSNNQFEGVWISKKSGKKYKCNWGEFRIPDSDNLDIGAGGFKVAKEYLERGWRTYEYAKGYGYASEASEDEIRNAKLIEKNEWWK